MGTAVYVVLDDSHALAVTGFGNSIGEFHPEFTTHLILAVCKHNDIHLDGQLVANIPNLESGRRSGSWSAADALPNCGSRGTRAESGSYEIGIGGGDSWSEVDALANCGSPRGSAQ